MSETVTVATANTHYGELLYSKHSLMPFHDLGTDILLLQETHAISNDFGAELLDENGFEISAAAPEAGLIIARSKTSRLSFEVGSERVCDLEKNTAARRAGRLVSLSFSARLRPRSILAANFITSEGQSVGVATTHLIVCARSQARKRQLTALGNAVEVYFDHNNPLVLAGDMNHYPHRGKADFAMAYATDLTMVPADGVTTYAVAGSRHERAAKLVAEMSGKTIEQFDGYLDDMFYRGRAFRLDEVYFPEIASDHRAIIGQFVVGANAITETVSK